MRERQVLYPCKSCADGGEGTCYPGDMIRVAPNGEWWCQNCYEEGYERGWDDEGEPLSPDWRDLPHAPDCSPARIEALEAALRPFVGYAMRHSDEKADDLLVTVRLGELRDARAALAQTGEPSP